MVEGRQLSQAWRRLLDRPLSLRWIVLLSAAIGVLVVLTTLEPGFILGGPPFWDPPWDDAAQSVAGLWAFLQDGWHVPLLAIRTYGVPEGANAANVDTIPLVSVLLKLLYPLTHHVFIFFGVWIAACRILNAVTGALLLSELGERRPLPLITVALLYGTLPSLLDKITNADLAAQFLVPASLIVYLRVVRAKSLKRMSLAAFALLLAALLVHPYLLVMSFVLYAAAVGERWRRGLTRALPAFGLVAVPVAGLLVSLLACGYLDALESRWFHYGEWSMNVLSPLLLAESTLLPAARVLGTTDCLPPEGVNYLGLGGIGLLVAALTLAPRAFVGPLRRHLVLCGVLLGLTLFALSNRVQLGHTLVVAYPLPGSLLRLADVFRASGRFFWPVSMALLVWCVAVVARHSPRGTGVLVLVLACGTQWVDLSGARARSLRRSVRPGPDVLGQERAAWEALVTHHRAMEVYPSYACGDFEENELDLQLQVIATKARVLTNSAYLSRPNKDCAREEQQGRAALGAAVPPGVLRIFYRRPRQPPPEAQWLGEPEACRSFDRGLGGIACTRAWGELALPEGNAFRPLPRAPANAKAGGLIHTSE
jgi:Family of unknown function (DUF6311)